MCAGVGPMSPNLNQSVSPENSEKDYQLIGLSPEDLLSLSGVVRGLVFRYHVASKFRRSLFWQISLIFSYDLCDANHFSYTTLHLFQRVAEHKYSAIGKHLTKAHGAWQRSFELKVFQSS